MRGRGIRTVILQALKMVERAHARSQLSAEAGELNYWCETSRDSHMDRLQPLSMRGRGGSRQFDGPENVEALTRFCELALSRGWKALALAQNQRGDGRIDCLYTPRMSVSEGDGTVY